MAIERIAFRKSSFFVLAALFAYAQDGSCSRWATDGKIRIRGGRGLLFPLLSLILRPVGEEAFMKLFDDSSTNLAFSLLTSGRSQKIDRSKSSCLGWFAYSFAERAVELVDAFTVLGRK